MVGLEDEAMLRILWQGASNVALAPDLVSIRSRHGRHEHGGGEEEMTIEAEFMRRVEADEVTLDEYLERINADSAAWAAEVPGRIAPGLVTDPAHWARYKITKVSQLAVYLDECSRANRR